VSAVIERPPTRALVALGLVTATTLAFQVALTRVLASALAYHFSFLAISIALLGTGAGALLLYVRPVWFERGALTDVLAMASAAYAVLLALTPIALVELDLRDTDGLDTRFILSFAAMCAATTLPALAAGIVVALAIKGYAAHIGRVYAFDLVGAGAGALAIVPVLWVEEAPKVLAWLGVVAAAAALLFAASGARVGGRAGRVSLGAALVSLVVIGASTRTELLELRPPQEPSASTEIVGDLWTPITRVTGYVGERAEDFNLVLYDRVYAPVPVVRGDEIPDWTDLSLGPQSVAYRVAGDGRALVIGGGGGRDIYNALSEGRAVDVIEINDGIRRIVDEEMGDVSGRPYSRDGVQTSVGDGRSILSRRDERYAVIHIGFTDTLSASSAQGFALTENSLYTVEAFDEYFDHLAPRGILAVTRLRRLVGDEAIRATVLTLEALEDRGITDPERHVVVLRGRDIFNEEFGTILARLEPFTEAELDAIRTLADERGEGVAFAPGGPYYEEWDELARASSPGAFCKAYPLDVCATTDDKPFFFNMRRLSDIGDQDDRTGYIFEIDPIDMLLLTLGILSVLSVIGYALPLVLTRRESSRPTLTSLLYFAAIGLGFLILEIVLIQRLVLFLGFPTYALSVVLFGLLVSSGIGAWLSSRVRDPRRLLPIALATVVILVVISAFGLPPVLSGTIDQPFAVRVAVAIAVITPLGIGLGVPMPLGLGRFTALHPEGIAYAWGVNGVASVLASVLGVTVALFAGFTVASLVAAGCYAIALVHTLVGRWAPT
jgi:hypothetical protein